MRLTERKIGYPSCDKKGNLTQVDYIIIKDKKLAEEKLCQLEDIEDNKQCDLLILNEVSKTWKIYSTWLKDYMHVINIVLWEEATRPYMTCWYFDNKHKQHKKIIFIDQYKETWSLVKEELL